MGMGKLRSWGGLAMAVAALAGCSNHPAPASSTLPAPVAMPGSAAGAPAALAPLTAAPSGTKASPAAVAPAQSYDRAKGTKTLDIAIKGDAARIVYPAAALTPGQLYPALVFAHGHGMDQTQFTDRTDLADAAAAQGWLSAGGAFGGRAAWANDEALADVGTLLDELVAHHQADPKRLYLVGFSMGGGTALLATANPLKLGYRVAAVASTQGFTDLSAMQAKAAGGGQYADDINAAYGGLLTPVLAAAHSPLDAAAALGATPVYLEHGEADVNVPVSHTLRMAAALKALGHPPEVHTYPGMTHAEGTIHTDAIINFFKGKAAS